MRILVCGGAGYIGSHTLVELVQKGHDVVVLDNFCNSSPNVFDRVRRIVGADIKVINGDIRSREALDCAFGGGIDVVVHFAALKSVGNSVEAPLTYYENNVGGTFSLLHGMQRHGVSRIVFSSSATVYGAPDACPINEDAPVRPINPYGRTKLVAEELIGDLCVSDPRFGALLLRYFNPVGAHASGLIGEDPHGVPNNLMPFVCQVAVGRRPHLNVFGRDYLTPDGTGVRDYIHVVDLAKAHVAAVEYLVVKRGRATVNLGTGRGYSVLELVNTFEEVSGRRIPLKYLPRRAGDVAQCFADPTHAADVLGWRAEFDLRRMCEDAWRWQSAFPNGYVQ